MAEHSLTSSRSGPQETLAQIGGSWGWYVLLGVLSILTGVIALVWPGRTLLVLAVIFGLHLVLVGVFRLIGALAGDGAGAGPRILTAVVGLFAVAGGVFALRHVLSTVVFLGLLLGIYWIVDGVTQLFVAVDMPPHTGRGWTIAGGILAILFGILLVSWPSLSLLTLAILAGSWLIVYGITQIGLGRELRQIPA